MANLDVHRQREDEMNQERMRCDQILQEAAAQQVREANKGKSREVMPDSEEEFVSSESEECIIKSLHHLLFYVGLVSNGNRRDKPTIEFDPEIEKTLKKNRSRVKAQRALQFEQEDANSEEDNANNQRRTLAGYTNPTIASCGSSIVWPTVDANNFELKPALVQLVQQNQFGGN
ncbi:hypothetical protein PIB30_086070 [Stylosanthes scabra]|uniref:Uncharacterized protein n=1 Tax=Stylosanthes scabra TaxID=79078 RepID=A0ABU6QU76_9FABA|nr:hypothetical protein [Stylosanthes scabra]